MPKITEISRSFSKTIQERQYEPISIFSSYKGELDGSETPEQIKEFSESLYILAMNDVGLAYSEKEYQRWTNPQKVVRTVVKATIKGWDKLTDEEQKQTDFVRYMNEQKEYGEPEDAPYE